MISRSLTWRFRRHSALLLGLFALFFAATGLSSYAAQPTLTATLNNRTITLTGASFPALNNVLLTAEFGGTILNGQALPDANGAFTVDVAVPDGFSGRATLTARAKRVPNPAPASSVPSTPPTNTPTASTPPTQTQTYTTPNTATGMSGRIYGLTLNNIASIDEAVATISSLPGKPAVRVVFDEGQDPSYYTAALGKLQGKAVILGEILDSFYVKDVSVAEYNSRAQAYVQSLGGVVDYWEIGNEINGEWLGSTPDVVAKLNGAHDIVKQAGYKTAITTYYNQDCWADKANEMLPWVKNNINATVSQATDLLLVSYYEDDCNNLVMNESDWIPVFDALHQQFPNAQLGFGEVGIPKPVTSSTQSHAEEIMRRYFTMNISTPNYIGGYYWWYGYEDIATGSKTMLPLFTQLMSGG